MAVNLRRRVGAVVQTSVIRYMTAVERVRTGVSFNPLTSSFTNDPYPTYRKLLAKDPFHRTKLMGGWVVSRHRDITAILRDERMLADNRKMANWEKFRERAIKEGGQSAEEADERFMLNTDGPDHTRLRSLVSRAFTPRAVEALRPRIEELVEEQLSAAAAKGGTWDVMEGLAQPLPMTVIAEMLGIPTSDRAQFKIWSRDVARTVGNVTPEDARLATKAQRELKTYFTNIVEERRREPREDLMSALVAAEQDGDRLNLPELFGMATLLLVAGNETTTNLIGNGLIALLRHPDQMQALRDDPSLITSAVEELLRYDSPVQLTSRFPLEDVDLGEGNVVRANEQAIVLLGAANHDPEVFENPEWLDITRKESRHLSFGSGSHFCLGAPLARMEAQIALLALVQRFPDMKLAQQRLEWSNNIVLRGVKTLAVRV